MKTVLPKPLNAHTPHWEMTNSINRLIDVVAELREVVEGKQDKLVIKMGRGGGGGNLGPGGEIIGTYPTPSLKEQLLKEVKALDYLHEPLGDMVYVSDLEAIINRLMP